MCCFTEMLSRLEGAGVTVVKSLSFQKLDYNADVDFFGSILSTVSSASWICWFAFYQIWNIFKQYFFKCFSALHSFSSPGTPIKQMLDLLYFPTDSEALFIYLFKKTYFSWDQ